MRLEVNNNHKKIEFGNLKRPLERFTIGLLGTTMAISLYSGALIPTAYAFHEASGVSISEGDIEADIPMRYQIYIRSLLYLDDDEPILESMINKITFLAINAGDNAELEYLRYFPNLTELSVRDYSDNGFGLNTIGSLPNLKKMNIYSYNKSVFLNSDSLKFLDSLNLDSITLFGYVLCPGCEDSLNKVSEIKLSHGFYDIDFSKLTGISKLDFSYDDVYSYSMYFSKSDYDALTLNGVTVDFGNDEDKFLDINSKLDSIIDALGIDDASSDQEKLDAVLLYVLENLEYDEYVSSQIANGNDNNDGSLSRDFYIDGYLYGALEKDSAICGNYTALVEALYNRIGNFEQSAFVHNDKHAWNIVKIDGEPYLVDATWLDGQTICVGHQEQTIDEGGNTTISIEFDEYTAAEILKSGDAHKLRWYMEMLDDAYIDSIDKRGSHKDALVPEYMFSENEDLSSTSFDEDESALEVAEEVNNAPDITNEKVKIKIGTKEMIITGGALIGVLSAIGGAVCIKRKNDMEKRRRSQASSYELLWDDFNDYGRRR